METNGNGRKVMVVANWKVYLGFLVILIQLFAYGFLFIQDRNNVINRIETNERAIIELKESMKVLDKIETIEINIRQFMKQQGYEYISPETQK